MSKCWGPKRKVEVWREPAQPLGISIVGGKVEMANNTILAGIFIKNVVQNSPAGRYANKQNFLFASLFFFVSSYISEKMLSIVDKLLDTLKSLRVFLFLFGGGKYGIKFKI